MPVHSSHTVKAGTTSKLFLLFAVDATGEGLIGLAFDTPGARAAYVREGEGARAIPLSEGQVGEWSAGGFVEVDPELLPGVYQLGAPDEMLAPGSSHALALFLLPAGHVPPVEVELVAYDPQDEACMGMAQLQDDKRHEFLRRALPRLTEQELALGARAEAELSAMLAHEAE
jgi:hypothetical protein